MVEPAHSDGLPSLLRTTFRRSITLGRLYLGIGLGYSVILTLVLGISLGKSASGESSFTSSIPTLLPIFAVQGSMGAMVAFSNDRMKGVFEYLIAYGVTPRRLFANSLVASLGVMSIQLGISVALVVGLSLARWHTVSSDFAGLLLLYSIPMSLASTALACMVGMYWTVVSSPREGMNSPVGLIPIVGIAPSILTLVVVGVVGAAYGVDATRVVLGVALAAIAGLALLLLSQVGRLLRTDRLLSPM